MSHDPQLPIYEEASSLRADGSRNHVHPADVRGKFKRLRTTIFAGLIVVIVGLPFLRVGDHPAIFLHVAERRFYLFGAVFNAQDFWLAFFVLSAIAFTLVFVTTLWGRVWCGYACPQTVFLEGVYRRVERWIEGPRNQRLKMHNGAWTFKRSRLFVLKHLIFIAISVFLAHVFLSYFVSVPSLATMIRGRPSAHPEAFAWVAVMSSILYFNFAWFREQLCLIICPYGRLQSALIDADSLVVGYDRRRGEPRGRLNDQGAGDCVQCNRCVAVCPTGIDIRNGLQIDCIGCSACIDACDEVMTKVGRAPGLIRYDSQNGFEGKVKRVWRPRLIFYAFLGALGLGAVTLAMASYQPFEANLLRSSTAPYIVAEGEVRNLYELHLVNKQSERAIFTIAKGSGSQDDLALELTRGRVALDPLESTKIPLMARIPSKRAAAVAAITLTIDSSTASTTRQRVVRAPFLSPGLASP